MISREHGEVAVRMARTAIADFVAPSPTKDPTAAFPAAALPVEFEERRGVFVTLESHPDGALRGCIGFPTPVYPLRVGIPRAAVGAASLDPRFPPVTVRELPNLTIEVSLLTPPEPVPATRPNERAGAIVVGRLGVIISTDRTSGLLLPQVAVEYGWSPEEFLAQTSQKAGLPADAWRSLTTTVERFEADVFGEETPGGHVVRHEATRPGELTPLGEASRRS
jgi:uncharacterized protein (TIGR00296 family)